MKRINIVVITVVILLFAASTTSMAQGGGRVKGPEFPGGLSAYWEWMSENLRYPAKCKKKKIEGNVACKFVVRVDGSATDVEVIKSAHPDLDQEAVRLLSTMPKWTPGVSKGKMVEVRVELPVVFKTEKKKKKQPVTDEPLIDEKGNINFPDPNFKAYMVKNFDINGDVEVSKEEAEKIISIDCSNHYIESLEGIEYCPVLIQLICYDNDIKAIDVSKNPLLANLIISRNEELGTIDVSKNTALCCLECYSNGLTALDVSNNKELETLYCWHNDSLTTLDVSNLTKLEDLHCESNGLKSLNVSGCTALDTLVCSDNQLTTLDVSSCPALELLYCHTNRLATLDVSQKGKLKWLTCFDNRLTTLDVSGCTALELLYCNTNRLAALDVSQSDKLKWLECPDNRLTTLDVSHNLKLKRLECKRNKLTALNVTQNTLLDTLWCEQNRLKELDVSHNPVLTHLICSGNQLTTLDVSQNKAITYLACDDNQLSSLDVSRNKALCCLLCNHNQLTKLNVSENLDLEYLACHNNKLATLNVRNNKALSDIYAKPMPTLKTAYLISDTCYSDTDIPSNTKRIYAIKPKQKPQIRPKENKKNGTTKQSEIEVKEAYAIGPATGATTVVNDSDAFSVVEQMPEFPGGMKKCMDWLAANLKYPKKCVDEEIEGRVICELVINKDGSISDIKVLRSIDPDLDQEAVRVIGIMPKWKPGKQRGKVVRVKYTLPITFRLSE